VEAITLVVPAIASIALGGALLVPIRDGRHGRKATVGGRAPLLADFRGLREHHVESLDAADESPSLQTADEAVRDGMPLHAGPGESEADATVRAIDDAPQRLPSFVERFGAALGRLGAFTRDAFVAPKSPEDVETLSVRSFADELSTLLPIERHERDEARPPSINDGEVTAHAHVQTRDQPPVIEVASVRADPVAAREPASENVPQTSISSSGASRPERAVPLTRVPLRFVAKEISWPKSATPELAFASERERYAYLHSCGRDSSPERDALLARAFREETPMGRGIILAALRTAHLSPEATGILTEALDTGSDEERDAAIDALSEAGAREEVARGLTDRIEAIAAKAALAYVGTTARDDYRVALAPFVDDARIEAILGMLAGVVE
jgi:hypothetical protein